MMFCGAISFVIVRLLIKSDIIRMADTKVKKYIKNLENVAYNLNSENNNLVEQNKILISDNRRIITERNKFAQDMSNKL